MNKAILLLFVILAGFVSAEQIVVLNFHYDDGIITFKDRDVRLGYYPDRNYQPENGLRADLVTASGESLYSFRFKIPLTEFTDYESGSELKGVVIQLTETDFSLIIPYFEDAAELNFYNERNYKITTVDISKERLSPAKVLVPMFVVVGLILCILVYMFIRRRNQQ
ncbi:MAG: hypothetical protein ABIC04_02105 [Nanoarchaeota archaeon]